MYRRRNKLTRFLWSCQGRWLIRGWRLGALKSLTMFIQFLLLTIFKANRFCFVIHLKCSYPHLSLPLSFSSWCFRPFLMVQHLSSCSFPTLPPYCYLSAHLSLEQSKVFFRCECLYHWCKWNHSVCKAKCTVVADTHTKQRSKPGQCGGGNILLGGRSHFQLMTLFWNPDQAANQNCNMPYEVLSSCTPWAVCAQHIMGTGFLQRPKPLPLAPSGVGCMCLYLVTQS